MRREACRKSTEKRRLWGRSRRKGAKNAFGGRNRRRSVHFSKNGKRELCCVEKRQSCGKPCGNCVKLLICRGLAILLANISAAKNRVFPQNGRFAKNKKFRFFQSAKIVAFSRPILDRRDTLVYNNIVCCIHQ